MPGTYVLAFRGIGEPIEGPQLLDQYLNALPVGWQRVRVPWLAEYGPVPNPLGVSYSRSLAQGIILGRRLIGEIRHRDPEARIVLVGYSGGAALAGNLANQHAGAIAACVLVADPNDPRGGIAGARPVTGVPVVWVANPADVICRCPDPSPLRILARLTPLMGLGARDAWQGANDVIRQLGDRRTREELADEIGPWWLPTTWGRYDAAIRGAHGYLSGREHADAYRRRAADGSSLLTRVAEWTRKQLSAPAK